MYYISVTCGWGNVVTEVQGTTCFKGVVMAQYCLPFKHPVCYYCKTLFLIQKKLPTMHFKDIKSH